MVLYARVRQDLPGCAKDIARVHLTVYIAAGCTTAARLYYLGIQ